MTHETLDVRSKDVGATSCVLTVVGDLDRDSAVLLRDAVDDSLGRGRVHIVVDLLDTEFCDSGGLSVFVDAHRRTSARGGWFRLARPGAPVLTVLSATNLDGYLTVCPTIEAAVEGAH
jgi:anti-anti-sigma factor